MPWPERSDRPHKAVLWEKVGTDRAGEPVVAPAAEIDVRWEYTDRRILTADAAALAIDATAVTDRRIPVGSILWKGELVEFDAETPAELMKVETYRSADDVKGRVAAHQVGLVRFRSLLPTVREE